MTISSTTNTVSYTGTGSATSFAVSYVFFGTGTSAELQVVEVIIATGAETVKTNGTDFTVTGGSGSTGTVTAASPPASTVKWVINRTTTQTQETDYVENDPFPAESHEKALDRLTAVNQEQQRALGRTAQLPDGYTGSFDPTLPVDITGNTVLSFNAGATAFEIGPTTSEISNAQTYATNAANSATASANSATASANSATDSANSATASADSATEAAASAASIGLTTRGDMLKRGASANERLAIGSANTVLTTNGTDPAWSTITNAMLAGSIDLTSKVTGALPLANGGTGATSLAGANIVATNAQNTFTKAQVPSTSTAALSASSGVLDFDTFTNFIITLASGSNTLAAPTTEASQIGQCGVIIFIQPSSSSAGTLSLHGDYETAGAAGITLSTANNAYDVVPYIIKADNSVLLGAPQLAFG